MARGSLAVIDTPSAPLGWEQARPELVRIVDPLGRAVAWLAPGAGGRCVGFAVRPAAARGTPWVHLLRTGGACFRCRLVDRLSRPAQWRLVERDPTAALLSARLDTPAGVIEMRQRASLESELLTLELDVVSHASQAVEVEVDFDVDAIDGYLEIVSDRATPVRSACLPADSRPGLVLLLWVRREALLSLTQPGGDATVLPGEP